MNAGCSLFVCSGFFFLLFFSAGWSTITLEMLTPNINTGIASGPERERKKGKTIERARDKHTTWYAQAAGRALRLREMRGPPGVWSACDNRLFVAQHTCTHTHSVCQDFSNSSAKTMSRKSVPNLHTCPHRMEHNILRGCQCDAGIQWAVKKPTIFIGVACEAARIEEHSSEEASRFVATWPTDSKHFHWSSSSPAFFALHLSESDV